VGVRRRRPLGPAGRVGRFVGVVLGVAAALACVCYALVWVGDHEAESYGNRLLHTPQPGECRLARAIVRDFAEHRSAGLRRAAGAGDRQLEMQAYAWMSDGARAPPGADWRWCPGFGPYVRSVGLARMGGGAWGPSLYISRIPPAGSGQSDWAWVTFFPPQTSDPAFSGHRRAGATTWRVVFAPADQPAAPAVWTEIARRPAAN
jgi:hypothetical protein